MYTTRILAALATASVAAAQFDALANTNMAVYWGQGPAQKNLAHFCADSSIDIIPIAFLNIFPDQVGGGYPGTNFGNQCGSETYKNKDGSWSPLLSNCPAIGPDIKTCQALGKKILLSLGGAIPTNQSIKDDTSAISFAKFLWNAFGPEDITYHGPRPFGDAVIDGFDFDIESTVTDGDAASQYRGYGTMIDTLRTYFAADLQKKYYISGAPQCVIPDAHLAHPIETSWFDFLFIQFYNTPQCSARAYFDASYGAQGDVPSDISFDAWVGFIRTSALNKDVKLYIGLPAAPLTQLAYDTAMYIAPDDVINLIELYQCRYPQEFGGIMVFEATYSEQNLVEGKPYVDVIKGQLTDCDCAKKPATSSLLGPTPSSSSVVSSPIPSLTLTTSLPIISASASLPPYPTSTGLWNSTSSTGPTAPIGTGSSSIPPYPSSTGIWNSTTLQVGTGSSSIPSYPSSSGIWNSSTTSSFTGPIGTGSSSIPSYPSSTGIWNSTYVPGPTVPFPTGTALTSSVVVSTSISTISPILPSSLVPTGTLVPTGISVGFSSAGPSSSAPFPINNGTVSASTAASSSLPISSASSNSLKTTTSVSSTPVISTSAPATSDVVTVIVVTSYTTCPVTSIITSGGSESTQTTYSISTIYSTVTSTVCTKCIAPSTPAPAPTSPTAPESTTIEVITTYLTTCPVTNTATVHGSTSVYTTSSVSTVYTTVTSIIPVAPVPVGGSSPIGHGPAPGHGTSSSPPVGPGNNPIGSGSHDSSQPEQPAHSGSYTPANTGFSSGASSVSSGNGNGAIGAGSNFLQNSPSLSGAGAGNSPSHPQVPSPAPEAPGLSTTLQTSIKQITATIVPIPVSTPSSQGNNGNSPQGANGQSPSHNGGGSSLPAVITETLLPIPVNPSQTAHPAVYTSGGLSPVQASPLPSAAAPFPVGNGTSPEGPSGGVGPSASASGRQGSLSATVPFTGTGNKMGGSILSAVLMVGAALLVI